MSVAPVELVILPERPVVRNDEKSEIDVVVEVRCKPAVGPPLAPNPLNLCVVIDRSGSMNGPKLEMAKRSCLDIFRQLRAGDLFTVVTFDERAQVVVNPQVSLADVPAKIQQVASGGQTNLSLGWYLGLLELQTHTTREHNNRLFLLSDGQANEGETKRVVLAKEAAQFRESGITTSTIGIGEDFQEDLLEAIASESGGRFWYVQESKIEDIIEAEFQGALTVAVDRPRVELRLGPGVVISKELNALNKPAGKYRVRPIKGEDVFNFAVRLETTPEQIRSDRFTVAAVLYDGERKLTEAETTVGVVSQSEFVVSPSNPLVRSVVRQYEAAVAGEKILEKMADGDLNLMKKMLMEEVGGMRMVRDALAKEPVKESRQHSPQDETERVAYELNHIGMDLAFKEGTAVVCDLLIEFKEAPEVTSFTYRLRKLMMHAHHRNDRRICDVEEFDRDILADVLAQAFELTETLAGRYPEKAASLNRYRELLSDRLARRQ